MGCHTTEEYLRWGQTRLVQKALRISMEVPSVKFLRIMPRIQVDFDCVFHRCMSHDSMLSSSITRYGWCSTSVVGLKQVQWVATFIRSKFPRGLYLVWLVGVRLRIRVSFGVRVSRLLRLNYNPNHNPNITVTLTISP